MRIKYICNAFSLQMLKNKENLLQIKEVNEKKAKELLNTTESAVGHQDTAKVLGVQCNRINISLQKGDKILVAQLQGGRLPEGVTTLPEGFNFKYLIVEVL